MTKVLQKTQLTVSSLGMNIGVEGPRKLLYSYGLKYCVKISYSDSMIC